MDPFALRRLSAVSSFVLVGALGPLAPGVRTGLDVLVAGGFRELEGRRVGLITNHTGIDRRGRPNVELMRRAENFELVALFSPEHGFKGRLEGKVQDGTHASGLRISSLYGDTRKPTPAMLEGVDCLVFDIQDIGCRFYTYISTMGLAMQAAAETGIRFVVLDRPNPIGGVRVEGPVRDAGKESFVGWHEIPVRHGMTVGELARLFQKERSELRGLDLRVVRMQGWKRSMLWDETGLLWRNPSPNIRNLSEAILYPGIGLLETTNVSVGRGTDTPFERVGAPWLDGRRLASRLNALALPGIRFYPFAFTPTASKFEGEECGGVYLTVTDRRRFEPVRAGIHIACALRDLFPDDWKMDRYRRLLGHAATFERLREKRPAAETTATWPSGLQAFAQRRSEVLLYR